MNNKARIIIGDSRQMIEIENNAIDLVVTSPPYWHIKDYEVKGQIGYGQSLHEYLIDLYRVWKECHRVLKPGRRLCINIGDQFARSTIYGRYKIIPLHAEFISQCEEIGFDYMGSIIWQKKTTMKTSGGANIMGSYPYPPNGMVEIDYEHILIFKKPGKGEKIPKDIKEESRLSKEEWKEYFYGHWYFGGAKQIEHEAMFPEELPKRVIKMFTFADDYVLDPFLGSGTTAKAALNLSRNAIGYEINEKYLEMIKEKIGIGQTILAFVNDIKVIKREEVIQLEEIYYKPRIKDARPEINPADVIVNHNNLYRVTDVIDERTIQLNTGQKVRFLGIEILDKSAAVKYLKDRVLKKEIFLKFDDNKTEEKGLIEAYVYLKNKIFINSYLIKSKIASTDRTKSFKFKKKFIELEES